LKKINFLKVGVFVIIFAVGFSIGFLGFKKVTKVTPQPTPTPEANIADEIPNPDIQVGESSQTAGTITPESVNMVNVLFLGMGGAGHDGGGLTDSITLASIDYQKKIINLIAIPRDLWYRKQKINSVYSESGANSIKFDVGQITGLKVNYFLTVDFANFVSGIDLLEGVDVENPQTWDDYFYPVKGQEQNLCGFSPEYNAEINQKYKGFELEKQFTCRYEHLHFDQGPVHLDGATALKYIRSRHSGQYGSDFARGERAQAVLTAIGKKLIEKGLTDPANNAVKKLVSMVTSDISLAKVPETLKTIGNLVDYKTLHANLTDQNVLTSATGPGGVYILIPKAGNGNFIEVRNLVKNVY